MSVRLGLKMCIAPGFIAKDWTSRGPEKDAEREEEREGVGVILLP